MEATPPQPPPPAPPPAPQGSTAVGHGDDDRRAGVGPRILAGLFILVLAFVVAVMVVALSDIGELTPCAEVTSTAQLNDEGECFDGSDGEKTLSLVLGWIGTALAALAAVLALMFAIRGRGGRPLLLATAAAAVLIAASILVN